MCICGFFVCKTHFSLLTTSLLTWLGACKKKNANIRIEYISKYTHTPTNTQTFHRYKKDKKKQKNNKPKCVGGGSLGGGGGGSSSLLFSLD